METSDDTVVGDERRDDEGGPTEEAADGATGGRVPDAGPSGGDSLTEPFVDPATEAPSDGGDLPGAGIDPDTGPPDTAGGGGAGHS